MSVHCGPRSWQILVVRYHLAKTAMRSVRRAYPYHGSCWEGICHKHLGEVQADNEEVKL